MLRLWPRFSSAKIWLALSIDGIAIVQQTRGLNKRILSQQYINVEGLDLDGDLSTDISVDKPHWPKLINQLDVYLSDLKLKKNTQLNVVLSSNFVRYLMLPAQQIAMSQAEKNVYTNAIFAEIYGVAANDWHIKAHPAAPDQNTVAVAVDKLLLTALNQLADKHQFKLNSVQPYLMAVFNALSKEIININGYFVLLENTKLMLVHLHKGVCQQLLTMPFTQNWQAVLSNMLNRELLLNEHLDATDKSLLIYAAENQDISPNAFNPSAFEGWKTQRINHDKQAKLAAQFYMLEAVL